MDLAALVERFHACATRAEFEVATLDAFAREVGFDVAFFASRVTPRATLTSVGLDAATLERVHRAGPTYGAELLPVKHAALASRGVAIDTEVLGERGVARCAYYRDLARPIGGRHSLLGYTRRLGVVTGGVMLGRTGSAFRESDRRCVEDVLPLLGLVSAVFERPVAPTEDVTSALTPRERDVLEYLCLGYTNREIALACGTSPRTVRNQLSRVFARLGASTRAEAVALAMGGAALPSR
jgi:DNA-binding CsgD family transcriptional regulator